MTKNRSFGYYALVGAGLGFLANILWSFTSPDVFNMLFVPLYKVLPISAVVPIFWIVAGAIGGLLYKEYK